MSAAGPSLAERAALLDVQLALPEEQFQALKFLLEERIPRSRLQPAGRPELCSLLLQHCPGQALPLSAALLRRLGRHDLAERLQPPGGMGGTEGPCRTGGTEGPGGMGGTEGPCRTGGTEGPCRTGGTEGPCRTRGPEGPGGMGGIEGPCEMGGTQGHCGTGGTQGPCGTGVTQGPCGCGEGAGGPSGASGAASAGSERRLTERELLQVARLLGKEWQEVAIGCLGLEKRRLEQIREDNPGNVVLQVFEALREWQRRQRPRATASGLRACLAAASVDPELLALLQSMGSG